MTNQQQPFHIFAAVGPNKYDHLKVGSVRLGRTLRAASAISRYTQAHIVAAKATEVDGKWQPTGAIHPVPTVQTEAERQANNRKRAQMPAAASLTEAKQDRQRSVPDEMVDVYREQLARQRATVISAVVGAIIGGAF